MTEKPEAVSARVAWWCLLALVADGQADAALARARELAARYPDDASVANALTTAEQAVSKEKR